MPVTERTPLTRASDSPDYVEFSGLLRTRRSRIRQFQCCICAAFIAVFTMALIVTVSYSVTHDSMDTASNVTGKTIGPVGNLTSPLKLGAALGSGSYTLFNRIASVPSSKSFPVNTNGMNSSTISLSDEEIREGLLAGRLAIENRMSADAIALASPLPSPSPESRHRYAVSTCPCVRDLALAAVGELAATKKIEVSRTILGEPSAMGSFFDGGWLPKGICKELQVFNCSASKYRTFDGTCNRPMQWGATMTPYRRSLPPNYADGLQQPRRALSGRELPSARELSLKVHKPSPSTNPSFTVMLAVYGQFLDHDITATAISLGINGSSLFCCPPTYDHPECFPVRVAAGDPVFDLTGRSCMNFVRSAPAPQCKLGPREQLNQVTSFIDGSTIYGSEDVTAHSLRELAGGRLRMQLTPDNRTLLPASSNPNDGCNREAERLRGRYCFAAGDARANENLHLTTMHLLWARQHNKVANELSRINPTWSDETLYQETRRILGAQLQHITYEEFVPIIIGEQESSARGLRPLKIGFRNWAEDPDQLNNNPTISNSFAGAAFRFAHTLLPGLMMMTDAQQGTSSYVELHRMLFNPYSLYAEGGVESSVTSATRNVIQMTSTHVTSQLTAHLFEDPIGNNTVPCGLDLVSLNIQRGRDHGLPGYTSWREYCGLGKPTSFADLEGHLDPQVLQEISVLYESVHDVDLYSGALAEIPKTGSIVGPTFTCLIADQFARLQRGDRFWYEVPNQPHSFTERQLSELRKTSLARIICDCSDGVKQVQAHVMRSVGANNPMLSCEDIPQMSLEFWKEDARIKQPKPVSKLAPFDWTALKTNINETMKDIITYINGTIASTSPATTDWLAFRNYINSSFNDLRDQLNVLHPPKLSRSVGPSEKISMDQDSFILRGATPPSIAEDWINFKIDLIKSLDNAIGSMASEPADPTKWIAFKQNIMNQIADLRKQISEMNAELAPKLLMERYKQEQAQMNQNKIVPRLKSVMESDVPVAAVFDWKDFRDDTLESLDDAILDIGENMPPPGDPAWASFGTDIKDRFAELHDKINMGRSTPPTELAPDRNIPPSQWGAKHPMEKTPFGNYNIAGLMAAVDTSKEVTNFTVDWLEFRDKLNQSLTHVIADININKPATLDPLGWAVFNNSTKNDFAQFKNDINRIKGEWLAKLANVSGTTPRTLLKAAGGLNTFDKSPNPFIPASDWADFKKQINDTLMSIINDAKNAKEIDMAVIQAEFNESFAQLKNEIASLKDTILQNIDSEDDTSSTAISPSDYWKNEAEKWASFRANLNSTINDLFGGLKNESKETINEVMKILFETRDKVAALNPPDSYLNELQQSTDWAQYIDSINKTIADSLNTVSNVKSSTIMVTASEPQVSSSTILASSFVWLIIPFTVTYCNTHLPTSKLKVPAGC